MNVTNITPVTKSIQIDNLSVSDESRREVNSSDVKKFESSLNTTTDTDSKQINNTMINGIVNSTIRQMEQGREDFKKATEGEQ